MQKGTVRFLKYNNFDHLYVKLDDNEFGLWRFENLINPLVQREIVHLTAEDLADNRFTILPAHGICIDLSNNRVCIITDKTTNSVEVFIRKVSEMGIDCRNWFTQKDFEKNYFTIPIDIQVSSL